ncbi:MAG TPA: hypothetical protein VK966_06440, partial [Longimicrobiales bacterium]|nr:hypothetical protein [Longimicrobiales bacterium]
ARASAQQAPGSAQEPSDLFDAAYQAWDAGDYGVALEGLGDVLERPDASGLLADIAVLTGERYHTLEVAPDGRAPRWSPDGRHAAYDVPGGAPRTVVVAVDDAGVRTVAELDGYGATFSPDGGSIAWLETDDPAALGREQQAIRDTTAVTNRAEWVRLNQALAEARARRAVVHVRDLATGAERELPASEPVYGVAWSEGEAVPWIRPVAVAVSPTGSHLVYQDDEGLAILDLAENWQRTFAGGESPALSGDGATLVFLARDGDDHVLRRVRLDQRAGETFVPETLFRATDALANPAVSQDGAVVAFQRMGRENWEVWVLEDGEGSVGEVPARAGESDAPRRLTHDVQHDLYPAFLSGDRLLVVKGEGRHRRSYVYPVRAGGEPAVREWVPGSGEGMRLFHNNTVRTVAPEYEWAVSPDGTKVLIVAERDGDTIDPARGLYLTDLDRPVSRDAVRARVAEQLAAERALRETADALFAGTVGDVRDIVADVSVSRIHGYAADLERMGTKYIGNPGNLAAIDYLV